MERHMIDELERHIESIRQNDMQIVKNLNLEMLIGQRQESWGRKDGQKLWLEDIPEDGGSVVRPLTWSHHCASGFFCLAGVPYVYQLEEHTPSNDLKLIEMTLRKVWHRWNESVFHSRVYTFKEGCT